MSNNLETTVPGADQESSADSALLPSFEDIMDFPPGKPMPDHPIHSNPKIRGIRWTLNGPLETAITLARDWNFEPNEATEPYYQGLENGKPIWHRIAKTSITKPKVSSLQLRVEPLDLWDYNWMEVHEGHTGPDEIYEPPEVSSGPLPDPVKAEAAGLDGDKQSLATGAYVTVHDFVSVVHLYLMARRDDILDSMNLD